MNSTTEKIVVDILNENRRAGISLSDPGQPIKKLERWSVKEVLRGVAGGASVGLIGAVVVKMTMLELGRNTGPEILVRFKICKRW